MQVNDEEFNVLWRLVNDMYFHSINETPQDEKQARLNAFKKSGSDNKLLIFPTLPNDFSNVRTSEPELAGTVVPGDALQLNSKNIDVCFDAKELSKMPRLKDCSIRQKSNGVFEIRYRRNGFDKSFSSKDKKKAIQLCNEFLLTLNAAEKKLSLNSKSLTFEYFLQEYFDTYLSKKIKDISLKGYGKVVKNHLSKFNKYKLKELTPPTLQKFFDELKNKGYGKTSEDCKIILNGLFKYAIGCGAINKNPLELVFIERHERKNGVRLTPEREKALLQKMQRGFNFELTILIILYSGVRVCEYNSIEFDFDAGVMKIKNGKLKKWQKNYYRIIPIFPKLLELKERIINENWHVHPTTLYSNYHKIWKENSLKDLRHTFSSKAREAGVDNELVNFWTGHEDKRNQTSETYTHFDIEYQKKEALKLKY